MRRSLLILAVMGALFLLASCGPPAGYDAAKQGAFDAQAGAKGEDAANYCPSEWAAAEQAMNDALKKDAEENWEEAMEAFNQAKQLYDAAKICAMKAKEVPEETPTPTPELPKPPTTIGPKTLDPIFFDFDRSFIRPDQLTTVKANAGELNKMVGQLEGKWLLTGYADIRGTDEYNMNLTAQRATAVYNFLVNSGVPAARLMTKAGGETTKFSAAITEEGYQLNRRVEFSFFK